MVLSSCGCAAGLLSLFVPKDVDQQDESGKHDKQTHEKNEKVNEAFEKDQEETRNTQSV